MASLGDVVAGTEEKEESKKDSSPSPPIPGPTDLENPSDPNTKENSSETIPPKTQNKDAIGLVKNMADIDASSVATRDSDIMTTFTDTNTLGDRSAAGTPTLGDGPPSTGTGASAGAASTSQTMSLKRSLRRKTTRSSLAKTGFRPRPLDPYKKLPVIRDTSIQFDISTDDMIIKVKKIGEGTLTDQLINNKELGQGNKTVEPPEKKVKKINIPAPPTKKSDTFQTDVKANYVLSGAYIRQRMLTETLPSYDSLLLLGAKIKDLELEYELTIDDLEWLDAREKVKPEKKSARNQKKDGPDFVLDDDLFERMIDLMEKATGNNTPISLRQSSDLFAKCLSIYANEDATSSSTVIINHGAYVQKVNKGIEEVYNYWVNKRSRLKKPLIRRFWPVTATNDTSPHLVFRPREKERYKLRKKRGNDIESYEKLLQLQRDFKVAHTLMELVRKREKLGQVQIDLFEDAFEQAIWDSVREQSVVPSTKRQPLVRRDKNKLFAKVNLTAADISALLSPPRKADASDANTSGTASIASGDVNGLLNKAEEKKKKKKRKEQESVVDALWDSKDKENDNKRKKTEEAPKADANAAAKESAEKEVDKIPSFLRSLDHLSQYFEPDELEICLPVIPSWPGTMPINDPRPLRLKSLANMPAPISVGVKTTTTGGARSPSQKSGNKLKSFSSKSNDNRKSSTNTSRNASGNSNNNSGQWVGIAAGVNDPSKYVMSQQRKRTLSTSSAYPHRMAMGAPLSGHGERKRKSLAFACRGRIGRGGRFIIDRIATEYLSKRIVQRPKEIYAPPHPLQTGQAFIDPAKTRSNSGPNSQWASRKPNISATQLTKIRSIYEQEDSEDEDVVVVDHPLLAEPRIDGEEKARLQKGGGGICKDRIPKFKLQI